MQVAILESHLFITMIKWIRTSRLSIKNSPSQVAILREQCGALRGTQTPNGGKRGQRQLQLIQGLQADFSRSRGQSRCVATAD